MSEHLKKALADPKWIDHKIGNIYSMDGKSGWKIAYYPIFEDHKKTQYEEPRALVEKPFKDEKGKIGIDFREVPLRYLSIDKVVDHSNDPFVLTKLESAKKTIDKSGLPDL